MIHVAFDLSSLSPKKSGVGVYTESLVSQLAADTRNVQISGYSSGRSKPVLDHLGNFSGRCRHLRVPTKALYASWNYLHAPKIERLVGKVDVFHGTNYVLPPVSQAKRILTVHDVSFLRCPELCPPEVVQPFAHRLERYCEMADRIIAVSDFTKRELVELSGVAEAKVTVVHEAIEFSSAREDSKNDEQASKPYLLFVGTLEKRKNLLGLLKAFKLLCDDFPHELVLAGSEGFGWGECAAYIRDEGLSDRVRPLGYVSDAEKVRLYADADAFVYPSLYEGFGIPILEAFAAGCPVVTMNTASMPEVAGEAAEYAESHDPDDLASALRRVLEDTQRAAQLTELGRQRLAGFSWERAARETLEVYRGLVS